MDLEQQPKTDQSRRGLSFWITFACLCLSMSLFALELTSVSTALPTIIRDLNNLDFVWVGSAYALASTAIIPICGSSAEIFGRKPTLILSVLTFSVGSALCGAARNNAMMLVGRTIQGLGGGAIAALGGILLGDLVPLRERGFFFGLLGLTWAIACAIGPIVGGSLASAGAWRWLFYLNLPVCGFCVLVFAFVLHLRAPRDRLQEKLRRVDWVGNVLIIGASVACALALTFGGVRFSWGSGNVLAPLCMGLAGLVLFIFYEKHWASDPIVPFALISNRTSASGYLQNFISPIIALASVYFIPIYYQACKGSSPLQSGVQTLGFAAIAPAAMVSGAIVGATQRYRPCLWAGWCLIIVGAVLLSTVHQTTSTGIHVGFTVILGVGTGFVYAVAQFPVQAPLPVSENGRCMAFYAFLRAFASIWGVTLGNAILQNELKNHLPANFVDQFSGGIPIVYAIVPQISALPDPLRDEVRVAFASGLMLLWKVLAGLGGAGLLVSFAMKEVPMHDRTDEKWGLESKENEVHSM